MLNQEEMCSDLATQTQLCGNRSCLFYFFCFRPQGLGIQGFYRQGFALCYSSLIYVRGPTVVLGPISQRLEMAQLMVF
jgi:hypothetical protein